MDKIKNVDEFYQEKLKYLYSAEDQLIRALPNQCAEDTVNEEANQ